MAEKKTEFNLTEGGILQKLLLVALPIMGTQLFQATYNLTDMFWLGRLGSGAVAASGTAGMFIWLSGAGMMIGRVGAEIGVSQSLGGGDRERALRFSRTAMQIALVIGVAYALFVLGFSRQLIGFFDLQEAEVAADATSYLFISALSIPFTFLSWATTGSFNGSGNSRTPFINNSVGIILNILLDPIFIFVADWGIEGAALATIVAQGVVCFLSFWSLYRSPNRPFDQYRLFVRPERNDIRQIFHWSTPIALESLFFSTLSLIVTRFTSAFGANAIAVTRVGGQVESLSYLVASGFSTALTAFIGQNFGAGRWGRIRQGVRISSLVMAIWGIATTCMLAFGGSFFVSLFLHEPDLIELGKVHLRILAACQLFGCLEAVGSGSFRGVGKTSYPSIISISCNSFRVVLAWILSQTSLGLYGIWIAVTTGAVLRGGITFLSYQIYSRKLSREDSPPVEAEA